MGSPALGMSQVQTLELSPLWQGRWPGVGRGLAFVAFGDDDDAGALAASTAAFDGVLCTLARCFLALGHDHGFGAAADADFKCDKATELRPMTSTRKMRSWELAVSRMRSMASFAVLTAVSKPMVSSVPACRCRWCRECRRWESPFLFASDARR